MDISIGSSTAKDPLAAAIEATRQASLNIKYEDVNLAIVFSSVDFVHSKLLKRISTDLREHVPIIGCSGAAIITSQGIFKQGVAVMLLSLPKGIYFNTACVKDIKTKTSLNAGRELGEQLLFGFSGVNRILSVVFSDGLMDEGSNFIYGMQERLGKSFPLVGASASDDLRFQKTYVYYNQEMCDNSATGVLLGGKLSYGLGIKHGWKPLGKPRIVTKAKGNIIYEIDNAPAIKIYEEYFGKSLDELQEEIRRISILYPIGILLPGGKDYLIRNILTIEPEGALRFQGNIVEGDPIRLMIGTKESCLAAAQEAVNQVKKDLSIASIDFKKREMNKFVLVFDSVSRYILLKRDAGKELEIIKEGLGENTPIMGIYTYGEQAPLLGTGYQGQSYFHNQTITVLAIGG
jgi:hypothetical protein